MTDTEILNAIESEARTQLGAGWLHKALCSVHAGQRLRDAVQHEAVGNYHAGDKGTMPERTDLIGSRDQSNRKDDEQ